MFMVIIQGRPSIKPRLAKERMIRALHRKKSRGASHFWADTDVIPRVPSVPLTAGFCPFVRPYIVTKVKQGWKTLAR